MSAKDNGALGQLLELLEARYALRVLWALKDGHPQTFRLLQDSVGGITPNTLNTRIKELREAGLVHHVQSGYTVTPTGADLLKRMSDLPAFAGKWSATKSRPAVKPASDAAGSTPHPDHEPP
ncbi:MAG: transcriptional regulator [Comamonadaceae bacterium]|nr:MAG: transcriptional regulator [Comamonadaceae bacterium]